MCDNIQRLSCCSQAGRQHRSGFLSLCCFCFPCSLLPPNASPPPRPTHTTPHPRNVLTGPVPKAKDSRRRAAVVRPVLPLPPPLLSCQARPNQPTRWAGATRLACRPKHRRRGQVYSNSALTSGNVRGGWSQPASLRPWAPCRETAPFRPGNAVVVAQGNGQLCRAPHSTGYLPTTSHPKKAAMPVE